MAHDTVRVLTFYIDPVAYRDRLLMLRAAAPAVGRIEVLLPHAPAALVAELSTPHFVLTPLAARPLPRWRREPAIAQAVLSRVSRGEVDLVHDTASHLLAVFAALRLHPRRPRLLSSSFTAGYEWHEDLRRQFPYESAYYTRVRWTSFLQERAICHLADAVTVFGEGHIPRVAHSHGVPLARLHSLPNCCDPAVFRPCAPDPASTGFPPGTRVLTNVGNQFIYKGTWELLRAFAEVSRSHDDARLLLVGNIHDEEEAALRAEPARLGVADRVRFVGRCPRDLVPVLLSTSDAFVFPSYTEGSPRAVLEAMACGLPVIATSLAGITALDPAAAFTRFVPRADAGALAAALDAHLRASPEDRARRAEAARARYLAHHTPDAAARPLVALYRTLCP
jgi:glycosyltransferase involved in cell wall biosynthesis